MYIQLFDKSNKESIESKGGGQAMRVFKSEQLERSKRKF